MNATIRDEIKSVPARWKAQNTDAAGRWYYPEDGDIYSRLMALDLDTATPDDIAAVIGNGSWVIDWPPAATGANITHAIVFEDGPVKGLRTVYEAYFNEQGDIDEVIRRELPGDEEE